MHQKILNIVCKFIVIFKFENGRIFFSNMYRVIDTVVQDLTDIFFVNWNGMT